MKRYFQSIHSPFLNKKILKANKSQNETAKLVLKE